jgi:hypothetical protein
MPSRSTQRARKYTEVVTMASSSTSVIGVADR